jgi:hypothetical protein
MMPAVSQVLKIVLEIVLVLGFIGLTIIHPMYRQYMQSRHWKEISAEFGFQNYFHFFYPEMKGQLRGRSILFQNSVNWGGRSAWSRLQIWIQLSNEAPFRFIIYQKGNNCYRPLTMGELEVQELSLDFLGERFALESKNPLQESLPLRDQHLINLFIGINVSVWRWMERNYILNEMTFLIRLRN